LIAKNGEMLAGSSIQNPASGYVVKVTPEDSPDHPRWIGESGSASVRYLGKRSDARIFPSRAEADREIRAFQKLLSGSFSYEIEPS
jgi:hypothetical protein